MEESDFSEQRSKLKRLRMTLMEVSIRDAQNNPDLYCCSDIAADLCEIHKILEDQADESPRPTNH